MNDVLKGLAWLEFCRLFVVLSFVIFWLESVVIVPEAESIPIEVTSCQTSGVNVLYFAIAILIADACSVLYLLHEIRMRNVRHVRFCMWGQFTFFTIYMIHFAYTLVNDVQCGRVKETQSWPWTHPGIWMMVYLTPKILLMAFNESLTQSFTATSFDIYHSHPHLVRSYWSPLFPRLQKQHPPSPSPVGNNHEELQSLLPCQSISEPNVINYGAGCSTVMGQSQSQGPNQSRGRVIISMKKGSGYFYGVPATTSPHSSSRWSWTREGADYDDDDDYSRMTFNGDRFASRYHDHDAERLATSSHDHDEERVVRLRDAQKKFRQSSVYRFRI